MPDIGVYREPFKWGQVNQLNIYYKTRGSSETKTAPNPNENDDMAEYISGGEFGSGKHFLEKYKSENVKQLIADGRTQTTPKPKGTGGAEECNSDDTCLLNSKYNDGKINIPNERKGVDKGCKLNESVIRGFVALSEMSRMTSLNTFADLEDNRGSKATNTTIERKEARAPTTISRLSRKTLDTSLDVTTNKQLKEKTTNLSNSGPLSIRHKLNGKIMFIIAATTEATMTTLGSSVQLNWLFGTEDAETIPIIQFQNQSGSFKVIPIVGGKYVRLVTRTDGETKITFIVNNVTDTDYGVYRCYLNNQPEEYKDIMLTDFNWISTNGEPIISTLLQDVVLSWEYLTRKSINKIIFSRQNIKNNHTIDIGVWTIEKGFKQNRVDVSTELVLNKTSINNGGGERISLELQYTVDNDFDKIYYCYVFYDDQISYKQGVELVAERSTCEGKVVQYDKNKSTFTWLYQYRFSITAVIISRIDSAGKEQDDLGYWSQNKFELHPLFKNRVEFNIKEMADDRREITLVLSNTTGSDFNSTYMCKVIPADGLFCQCELKLDALDDLNHDNYTDITGVTKPRDENLSSINSTPIIVVAVIIPLVIFILTTIRVVRKRRNRRRAPTSYEFIETEPRGTKRDYGIVLTEKILRRNEDSD